MVARKQQAKSWELRAAMKVARLWRDQAKPSQAKPSQAKPSQAKPSQAKPSQAKPSEGHAPLAPVYGWFTEGFGLDLRSGDGGADGLLGTTCNFYWTITPVAPLIHIKTDIVKLAHRPQLAFSRCLVCGSR
jgi:hypothetical protein